MAGKYVEMEQENDHMTQTSKISFSNLPIFWNFIPLIMQNHMQKLLYTKEFSVKLQRYSLYKLILTH